MTTPEQIVEELKKARHLLITPPHKRNDAEWLRAAVSIGKSFVDAAIDKLRQLPVPGEGEPDFLVAPVEGLGGMTWASKCGRYAVQDLSGFTNDDPFCAIERPMSLISRHKTRADAEGACLIHARGSAPPSPAPAAEWVSECLEWPDMSTAPTDCSVIKVWREDCGVFYAYFREGRWFSYEGEDVTWGIPKTRWCPRPAPAAEGDDYQRGWNDAMKYRGKESFIATADAAPPSPAPAAEEANICPHCGEEKPTPHVLVLEDDPYCDECWDAVIESAKGYVASPTPLAGEGDAEREAGYASYVADIMHGNGKYSERDGLLSAAAFIRTQAATITRLQAENDRLRDDLDLHKKIRVSQGALINAKCARLRSLEEIAERIYSKIRMQSIHPKGCRCDLCMALADYANWKAGEHE